MTAKDILNSVHISGLGCEAFQQGIVNIFLWDLRMSRQYEAQHWQQWTADSGKGYPTIQLTNRILTPSHLTQGADVLTVTSEMGKHAKALVDDGSHQYIQDNVIDLYEHKKIGNMHKYVS